MKLELKHLAAYATENLRFVEKSSGNIFEATKITTLGEFKVWSEVIFEESEYTPKSNKLIGDSNMIGKGFRLSEITPIFRPLIITNDIFTSNGSKVRLLNEIQKRDRDFYVVKGDDYIIRKNECFGGWSGYSKVGSLPNWIVEILKRYHLDVFGLIPAGLAIDVNTLKENPYENQNN